MESNFLTQKTPILPRKAEFFKPKKCSFSLCAVFVALPYDFTSGKKSAQRASESLTAFFHGWRTVSGGLSVSGGHRLYIL